MTLQNLYVTDTIKKLRNLALNPNSSFRSIFVKPKDFADDIDCFNNLLFEHLEAQQQNFLKQVYFRLPKYHYSWVTLKREVTDRVGPRNMREVDSFFEDLNFQKYTIIPKRKQDSREEELDIEDEIELRQLFFTYMENIRSTFIADKKSGKRLNPNYSILKSKLNIKEEVDYTGLTGESFIKGYLKQMISIYGDNFYGLPKKDQVILLNQFLEQSSLASTNLYFEKGVFYWHELCSRYSEQLKNNKRSLLQSLYTRDSFKSILGENKMNGYLPQMLLSILAVEWNILTDAINLKDERDKLMIPENLKCYNPSFIDNQLNFIDQSCRLGTVTINLNDKEIENSILLFKGDNSSNATYSMSLSDMTKLLDSMNSVVNSNNHSVEPQKKLI